MPRFVQFDGFGSEDVLRIVEKDRPWPGPGELVVRVMAAGLTALDSAAFRDEGAAARLGVTPPSGLGQDFAGFVEEVGEGVTRFAVGEAVFGSAPFRAFADFAVVAEDGVVLHKPDALTFEVAGSLAATAPAAGNEELASLAAQLAEDERLLPIDSIFPIERVAEAFARLEAGDVRGAIVLVTD